jgi:hypothetical protein
VLDLWRQQLPCLSDFQLTADAEDQASLGACLTSKEAGNMPGVMPLMVMIRLQNESLYRATEDRFTRLLSR